jgi:DNA-binding NarL/FixJ family response regulator
MARGEPEMKEDQTGGRSAEPLRLLSPAQVIVLCGIAQGKKSNQIADDLPVAMRVSTRGVIYHRSEIRRKLGVQSVAELTRIAVQCGLL